MSDYTFNNTSYRIKVNPVDGILQPTTPITLRNQTLQITSLEDISDVAVVDRVEGATVVYNSAVNRYEIKLLDGDFITGTIDGGTY